ncbi:FtsK/SpoIIIE domain-containing protein [Nocardiopsis sp. CT-R113]|uniref:FtsK/SpoIIIE domain-containing protein n=2 Tax=Nocardiopsis codii TaxID=3065942 RepID=A0ABU7KHK9_9ACTN|nr:cell division protein FtsK [Nocardiopsis sp. CT-R113]MEE2041731.1 FtsK/SpoIIIE domain-containing protein [Nocardiopsis sp. CT-R113]
MMPESKVGSAQSSPTLPTPAHGVRWTTPIVETPGIVVLGSWIWRLVRFLVTLPFRFPVMVACLSASAGAWWWMDWPGLATLWGLASAVSLVWWRAWPDTYRTWVTLRLLAWWRHVFVYRRHWQPVLVISGLAESYQERRYLPRIRRVTCSEWADYVRVTLVAGTSPADFETRVAELAHGFQAPSCRVVVDGPRRITLEFPRHDTLAEPLEALNVPDTVDLTALPIGQREDGSPWLLRLHGTHVLAAGVTGAGKGSVLWSAIRAMLPALADRTAQVWALDPKRMELSYGRDLFAQYADDGESAVAVLELAVADMQNRARRYAGKQRSHVPSRKDPFVLVVIDEVAFLTAYHPDRDVRRRAENAIATLTSQGRSVGFSVLAALQDPRKEVMNLRNLFPDKVALRLDEALQVDMILGEGARDRGGNAHLIDPTLPGVAYVRMETSPAPVRVRAAYVSDGDITAMVNAYGAGSSSVDEVP